MELVQKRLLSIVLIGKEGNLSLSFSAKGHDHECHYEGTDEGLVLATNELE